jgi:hypothetical protein
MVVFPETTIKEINSADCNDSVSGVCIQGKTFEQCINICNKQNKGDLSAACSSGYYISDPNNNNNNICVTLREKEFGNPYYMIRNKSIYPPLKKYNSTVFVNKNKWRFPPFEANTVFFRDLLTIINTETQLGIQNFPLHNKNIDIVFDNTNKNKNNNITLQIVQNNSFEIRSKEFSAVKYGDFITINIPHTNLVMEPINTLIKWRQKCLTCVDFKNRKDTFSIIPTKNSNKKIGDKVFYSDKFHLIQGPDIFGLENNTNLAKIFYMPIEKAISKEIPITFKFSARMKGFYCEDKNKCSPISYSLLNKFDQKGIGTYKGKKIFRTPGCFGNCNNTNKIILKSIDPLDKNKDNNENKSYSLFTTIIGIIIIIISITIIIIFIYQLIKSKNNENKTLIPDTTLPPQNNNSYSLSYKAI